MSKNMSKCGYNLSSGSSYTYGLVLHARWHGGIMETFVGRHAEVHSREGIPGAITLSAAKAMASV